MRRSSGLLRRHCSPFLTQIIQADWSRVSKTTVLVEPEEMQSARTFSQHQHVKRGLTHGANNSRDF